MTERNQGAMKKMYPPEVSKKGRAWFAILLLASPAVCCGNGVLDGKTLQAELDAGRDIALRPGQVVELEECLEFRKEGQRIETVGAKTALEYAKIVHAEGGQGTLIEASGIVGATLSKLVLDGNRPGFRPPQGLAKQEPMLSFGGEGAVGQEVRNCIVVGSRCAGGWAAIHVHEGGRGILVEDNLVFSSGVDFRGNGRSQGEKQFGMADGISTASRGTTIMNNLIYDATDEGIMVQGAPGTQVRDNVIVAISREMLGKIALIDPFSYYEMNTEKRIFDYRGVIVEENLILAAGSRIHAGFPLGGAAWNPRFSGTTLLGARILNNHISGKAAGYGYVLNGIDGFEILGNTSDATYSGVGDGAFGTPPDPPMAFMYDPATVGSSCLQEEFVPMKKSLVRVLRSNRSPVDPLGYRDAAYPEEEARAVVRLAFVEMLGRDPKEEEGEHWTRWLRETRSNGDALRCALMTTSEFIEHHGYVNPLHLHKWRNARWLKMILATCSEVQSQGVDWPDAANGIRNCFEHCIIKPRYRKR